MRVGVMRMKVVVVDGFWGGGGSGCAGVAVCLGGVFGGCCRSVRRVIRGETRKLMELIIFAELISS